MEERCEACSGELLEAMEEAKRISRDPNVRRYSSFSEILEELDKEV